MTPVGRAILFSVIVGLAVQAISLLVGRRFPPDRIFVGWGLGAMLRLVTLLLYGWIVVPALELPLTHALLTLVIVFFVTMLIEPFLLNSRGSAPQSPPIDK